MKYFSIMLIACVSLVCGGCASYNYTGRATSKDRAETETIAHKDFPTLIVSSPAPLSITTVDPDLDFLVYEVTEKSEGGRKAAARMTVYEGQFPQPLSKYMDKMDCLQVTTQFGAERSCWYQWVTKKEDPDGGQLHCLAYLYNTAFQKDDQGRIIHYIVQIHIAGTGPGFKRLQAIAESIRAGK